MIITIKYFVFSEMPTNLNGKVTSIQLFEYLNIIQIYNYYSNFSIKYCNTNIFIS